MLSNEHGGNIYRFMEERNLRIDEIVDFSASINPLGVPENVKEKIMKNMKYIIHYPDPEAKELKEAISEHLSVDQDHILCGNGSTELIYLVVGALRPKKVLIPAPTFSEYERAAIIRGQNSDVRSQKLRKRENFDIDINRFISNMKGCDMAFICNPNNPTGRLIKKDDLIKIADVAKDLKCYLLVDEAFIDFCPEHSVVKEVQKNPYLIVLRSMTKFYALSGLRIGYGVFPLNVLNKIKRHKEPWTINTLAQIAGIYALKDEEYREKTFRLMKKEKRTLEDGFRSLSITYIPSSSNFYLIRHESAQKINLFLKSKGIMVRDCSNFRGLDRTYIRVAVRSNKENMRLLKELKEICQAL